jgi:hypothetical protein
MSRHSKRPPVQHLFARMRHTEFVSDDTDDHSNESMKYLRWQLADQNERHMELQTRVMTFQRCIQQESSRSEQQQQQQPPVVVIVQQTIQLHAQFHFADNEWYYQYYNTCPSFIEQVDAVFYELLVDAELLQDAPDDGSFRKRMLKDDVKLQASMADQSVAQQYHWICQVNSIRYNNNNQLNWYHADLTRQEFLWYLNPPVPPHPSSSTTSASIDPTSRPLWQQVQDSANQDRAGVFPIPNAAYEATTALLVGPPMVLQQQQQQQQQNVPPTTTSSSLWTMSTSSLIRRRIFTNLFLPGDSIALWLRYILWITVPCPEISILLLDWSSSWAVYEHSSPTTTTTNSNKSRISPITVPMIQAIVLGRFRQVRKLVFGQTALTGHHSAVAAARSDVSNHDKSENSLLITQRNDHALQQVFAELERLSSRDETKHTNVTMALLYGCNHCPDLHKKLMGHGFHPIESSTPWRTAWSVDLPNTATHGQLPSRPITTNWDDGASTTRSVGVFLAVLVPLYFVVGGMDWIETINGCIVAMEDGSDIVSVAATALLYLLRHVSLYVGLSKLILDGESSSSIDRKV